MKLQIASPKGLTNKSLQAPVKTPIKAFGTALAFSAVTLLAACESPVDPVAEIGKNAIAKIKPTRGNTAIGGVTFTGTPDGVAVKAYIRGLTPGTHGFHIHENGDCSSDDGKSAGGHYAPEGNPHGGPNDAKHHTGDLGNVVANEKGVAQIELTSTQLSLTGRKSVIGKSVIVHGGQDDLKSQPSGAAGPRVGCGVIEASE